MRNRLALALVAALVIVTALGGVAGAGGSPRVKVGDNFFKPTRLQVGKGTTVRFKWVDTNNAHNVAKVKGPGRSFASDTTSTPGFVYKKRFRKAGRYKLICTIHPETMIVRIRVG